MAGGGRRPRCPPGALLSLAAVLAAAGWVRAEQKEEQSIDLIGKNEVYGDTRHEVNVYVKVFTNSPFLVCMDLALSQERIIDPNYLWTGPDGRDLQAYREADHAYQVSVRFSTTGCRLRSNGLFIEVLKKILNSTISHLTCHITESSSKCHSIRTPKNGLQYELFVNFLVNPFAPGWEEVCHEVLYDCEAVKNRRVRQVLCQSPHVFSASLARTSALASADMTGSNPSLPRFCGINIAAERIGKFFHQLRHVLKHKFQAVPTIQYVDNSFSMTPIDSCQPGFGKNHHTHQNCASCCVVCGPGAYSPNNEVTCRTCARTRARMYGAKSCY
ncbi:zona pellucida-binding protein 2 isoform X6 [Anomalospiza imberbis]|uniref:zona pellucida-binding protein 2 isoform X6 n=1 Tax=Anomalospiza imberbis TaxID=187417 RepID=UPI00358FB7A4